RNHGLGPVKTTLSLHFAADYADIFEVRGMKRKARGQDLPAEVTADRVVLGYRGLDNVVRRTFLQFAPRPTRLTPRTARLDLSISPKQEATFSLSAACRKEPAAAPLLVSVEDARSTAEADLERRKARTCQVRSSNGQFNAWV